MVEPLAQHPTADLLLAAQGGDLEAFDRLFARVTPRLLWFVEVRLGSKLRSRVEPEDVLQETFAEAWPRVSDFDDRGPGSFQRWLFALAENRIRSLAGHHGAQRRDGARQAGPADRALALAFDPHSGPCTRAVRVEQRLRVAQALSQLDEDEREILLARLAEGRPFRELAERLGRGESATRRLLARAATKLGHLLRGEGDA